MQINQFQNPFIKFVSVCTYPGMAFVCSMFVFEYHCQHTELPHILVWEQRNFYVFVCFPLHILCHKLSTSSIMTTLHRLSHQKLYMISTMYF